MKNIWRANGGATFEPKHMSIENSKTFHFAIKHNIKNTSKDVTMKKVNTNTNGIKTSSQIHWGNISSLDTVSVGNQLNYST